MDENQNFGYNESSQGAMSTQQTYENPQYSGQSYENPQYDGQTYDNQQAGLQYGQPPYSQQTGPQYSQTPYGLQQQYNQQNFGQPVKAVVYDTVPDGANGPSVAALVCGILALVLFWVPGLDLILCLTGLICAIVSLAKGSGNKGMAITGLVFSIISGILSLVILYVIALGIMLA